VSALLVAHLTVVIVMPMTLGPRSELTGGITRSAAPYLQAGNVSHFYAFFAPNPGPSHIIKYELVFEDGKIKKGRFPDIERQWPRLLYHRHFMLTDQLEPPGPDPRGPVPAGAEIIDDDPVYEDWVTRRDRFLRRMHSYGKHLLKKHQCNEVRLQFVRHLIPFPSEVLEGRPLNHQDSYLDIGPQIVVRSEDGL
jgi:hypothetical protein